MSREVCCDEMLLALDSEEIPIVYVPKFREHGVRVLDGGPSFIRLSFCPWCGQKLPDSLREPWFKKLESLGIDPGKDTVPAEFTDERWYSD